MANNRTYGWRPDKPDHRDQYRIVQHPSRAALPSEVDLSAHCPFPYDQGNLGSCTAMAIGAAIEFDQLKQGGVSFIPSRLFIYYNERATEGTVNWDAGAEIRDGIKSINVQGACPERFWPYDITKFTEQPSDEAYAEAKLYKSLSYQRVEQSVLEMKACLADQFPFIFGFTCYDSFESDIVAQTGIVDLPRPYERAIGGHAPLAIGYSDTQQRFKVLNSYGNKWGQAGYFTIPYAYLENPDLAEDFWTIRIMGEV